jgi:hypothetical protein
VLIFLSIFGVVLILAILLDAFETIVLPRRVTRHFRLTAWFYRNTWIPWRELSRHVKNLSRRESFLGYFGPLSLIFLLAVWATGLIFGFACVQYGAGEHVILGNEKITFFKVLYHSGETFFTLGYGDIVPVSPTARALAVFESGMGFAFLGVVIGYLPVVYSAFSKREIEISLLDARAGSPPTAAELLNRLGCCPDQLVLDQTFRNWETWCADLLVSHISYPVLLFFRSQHYNQSWLAALTVMLDTTSLVMTGAGGIRDDQAKLTFAIARHAAVDLAQVMYAEYSPLASNRLPPEEWRRLQADLAAHGVPLNNGEDALGKLAEFRSLYEPYLQSMEVRLAMTLPPWLNRERKHDNWKGGPWDRAIQAKALQTPLHPAARDHF